MNKKWGGNRMKNFYGIIWGNTVRVLREREACENTVGLSMSDGPIETVKCIWLNIWCMLDWVLSPNCRRTIPLHTVESKNLDAVVPNKLLAANAEAVGYQSEEYKNSGLVVILHNLNSSQHNNYVEFSLLYVLLRENHKTNAVCFLLFHNGSQSHM